MSLWGQALELVAVPLVVASGALLLVMRVAGASGDRGMERRLEPFWLAIMAAGLLIGLVGRALQAL